MKRREEKKKEKGGGRNGKRRKEGKTEREEGNRDSEDFKVVYDSVT